MTMMHDSIVQYLVVMAHAQPPHDDYYTIAELLLERGTKFSGPGESLNKDEAAIIDQAGRFEHFEQRECFYNAQRLAYYGDNVKYWEGVAQGQAVIPVHHAWVTINGKVVDLTWRFFENEEHVDHPNCPARWKDRFAFGTMPKEAAYRGVEIDASDALRRMIKEECCYSYLDDWVNRFPLLRRDAWKRKQS